MSTQTKTQISKEIFGILKAIQEKQSRLYNFLAKQSSIGRVFANSICRGGKLANEGLVESYLKETTKVAMLEWKGKLEVVLAKLEEEGSELENLPEICRVNQVKLGVKTTIKKEVSVIASSEDEYGNRLFMYLNDGGYLAKEAATHSECTDFLQGYIRGKEVFVNSGIKLKGSVIKRPMKPEEFNDREIRITDGDKKVVIHSGYHFDSDGDIRLLGGADYYRISQVEILKDGEWVKAEVEEEI